MEEIVYKTYQYIGDYLTGRRRQFFILATLLIIILIALSIYFKIEIPQETLYWVFSSIVQALLAFVALFGVVAVFKLQNIHTNEERLIEELNKGKSLLAILGGVLSAISAEELLNNIKRAIGDKDERAISGDIYKQLWIAKERLETYRWATGFVREFMLKFIIYTFGVVILSLIFLATSHFIFQYNLGLPAIFLIILLTVYSLFLAIKGTAETLF